MAYDKFAAVDSSTLLFPPTVRANLAGVSPNYVINGGFDIWQRGTSFSNPTSGSYLADRWVVDYNGTGATRTISQQVFNPGELEISTFGQPTFYLRYNQSVAGSGGTFHLISSRLENVRTLAGQTVTVSFWAKANASKNVGVNWTQNFGSGGSNVVFGTSVPIALSTSWARYSTTFTLPSLSGKTVGTNNFTGIIIDLPANDTFTIDITGVQAEVGAVATPFRRNANSIQGELAACQRYYQRLNPVGGSGRVHAVGWAYSTTGIEMFCPLATEMRTSPSSIDYSTISNFRVLDNVNTLSISVLVLNGTQSGVNNVTLAMTTTTAGLTQFRPYMLRGATSDTYVGLNAEL